MLFRSPLTKTLPVGLADAYASMRLEVGSAYTLIFFVMILPLLAAMQAYGNPKPKKRKELSDELKPLSLSNKEQQQGLGEKE